MKVFSITFGLSVLLIVGGFVCPPIGVIDGSVLSAVGLLLMFATIDQMPQAIQAGRNLRIQKGNLTIESSSAKVSAADRNEQ